jgi:pimeloyl-ACP methyl ester carboxylesterase
VTAAAFRFTAAHRGGAGPPLVCLHGFLDTWRAWELVLPALEARHDVLAPTLPGHAGGPPLEPGAGADELADALEALLDGAGFETAHLVGSSLGGHLALRLAERGRAMSVVALAPAGGWAPGDAAPAELLDAQRELHALARGAAPYAEGLTAHRLAGAARCDAAALIESALRDGWSLEPERISCPVRVVWGTADTLLPWPSAAARYERDWLPHADWVVLDGVGHDPQLEVPLETAQLILGFTAR